jgi:hypothetical protein
MHVMLAKLEAAAAYAAASQPSKNNNCPFGRYDEISATSAALRHNSCA